MVDKYNMRNAVYEQVDRHIWTYNRNGPYKKYYMHLTDIPDKYTHTNPDFSNNVNDR